EVRVRLLPLLFGDIEIERLILIEPDILLETDRKGRGNWNFEQNATPAPAADGGGAPAALPRFDELLIKDGVLSYHDGVTGKTTRLSLKRLEGHGAGASAPLRLEIDGAFDKTGFKMRSVLGPLSRLTKDGPYPVELEATAAGATVTIKGTVDTPMKPKGADFTFRAEGKDLARLGALAATDLPSRSWRIAAKLVYEPGIVTVKELDAAIGKSALKGAASLNLAGARPKLKGKFTLPLIDLADFTAPEGKKAKATKTPTGGGKKRLFSAEPLPLDGLKAMDADVTIHAGRIVANGAELRGVDARIKLAGGRLRIQPLMAGLAGGGISGDISLDAAAKVPAVKAKLVLKKIDVGALLKDMKISDQIKGKIDLDVNVRGGGRSLGAMMASLGGRASLVMGKGSVDSGYVDLIGADLLQFAASPQGMTRVNCLVARFNIAKGIATANGLLFDTERMTVRGEGNINLGAEKIRLKFTPKPKQRSLINVAVPWWVTGDLASPSVTPDETAIATGIAGTLLLGPLALAVPLVTGGSGEKNPCLAALNKPRAQTKPAQAPQTQEPAKRGGIEGMLDDIGKGISKGFEDLFGR
ncbi:MAG: AsmA family protein, partial [Alphaproteobacteria bacterium]